MRHTNRRTEQRPSVEETSAVGEVGADHDECLDAEESGCVHEGCNAKRLHGCCD